jgi:hypothetical protein
MNTSLESGTTFGIFDQKVHLPELKELPQIPATAGIIGTKVGFNRNILPLGFIRKQTKNINVRHLFSQISIV